MGLFSRALLNRGLERASGLLDSLPVPSKLTPDEWTEIKLGLRDGNEQLRDAMLFGGRSSTWEWGNSATPHGVGEVRTDNNPYSVGIPLPDDSARSGFVFHNHPSTLVNEDGALYPVARLSTPDLAGLSDFRGTTALDGSGGYGYAIANPDAPRLPDAVWRELEQTTLNAAHKSKLMPGQTWRGLSSLTGAPGPSRVREMEEGAIPRNVAVGRALKRTGMLEQYGLIPGTNQQAKMAALYEPATEAASKAAEEIVSSWLRHNGYKDGVVRSVIASLTAAGTLSAMAASLANGGDDGRNADI